MTCAASNAKWLQNHNAAPDSTSECSTHGLVLETRMRVRMRLRTCRHSSYPTRLGILLPWPFDRAITFASRAISVDTSSGAPKPLPFASCDSKASSNCKVGAASFAVGWGELGGAGWGSACFAVGWDGAAWGWVGLGEVRRGGVGCDGVGRRRGGAWGG